MLSYALTPDQSTFKNFAQRLIELRKAHPALRPAEFYKGVDTNGNVMEQIRWFKPDGGVADAVYLDSGSNHAIAWRIDGTELGDPASAIYIAYNGWSGGVSFSLPWPGSGRGVLVLIAN
jgi:glycogen operon protein